MSSRPKYHLYVDETGQHTRGQIFIVAIACLDADETEHFGHSLVQIEEEATSKGQRKWARTPIAVRRLYLKELALLCQRTAIRFYYRVYGDGTDYLPRTGDTIVAAIEAHQPAPNSSLTIVVDGLNPEERQRVSRILRRHALPCRRTVRGGRDESTPFIRLVDAVAGFIRHVYTEEPYAKELWQQLRPYLQKL